MFRKAPKASTFDLDRLTLSRGGHRLRSDGTCVMEAVAWAAEEKHSASPATACPLLTMLLIGLNDSMEHDERQQLKALIPKMIASRGDMAVLRTRAYMALDWVVRVHLATWLRAAGREKDAERVSALPAIVDGATVTEATNIVTRLGSAFGFAPVTMMNRSGAHLALNLVDYDSEVDTTVLASHAHGAVAMTIVEIMTKNPARHEAVTQMLQRSCIRLVERMIDVPHPDVTTGRAASYTTA